MASHSCWRGNDGVKGFMFGLRELCFALCVYVGFKGFRFGLRGLGLV